VYLKYKTKHAYKNDIYRFKVNWRTKQEWLIKRHGQQKSNFNLSMQCIYRKLRRCNPLDIIYNLHAIF